jgi:hypothetical protein
MKIILKSLNSLEIGGITLVPGSNKVTGEQFQAIKADAAFAENDGKTLILPPVYVLPEAKEEAKTAHRTPRARQNEAEKASEITENKEKEV